MGLVLRLVGPLLAVLATSGCNMVISTDPWFSVDDTTESPRLRDGLWVRVDGSDECKVKLELPANTWPDCASPVLVRGTEWREPNWEVTRKGHKKLTGWQPIPVLLAAGEPPIIQAYEPGETASKAYYLYLGMRPLATGGDGRVYALALWLVECGPLSRDEADPGDAGNRNVTSRPFAGLTVKDDNCTAQSQEALRNAARQSEGLNLEPGERPTTMRWLRESWP